VFHLLGVTPDRLPKQAPGRPRIILVKRYLAGWQLSALALPHIAIGSKRVYEKCMEYPGRSNHGCDTHERSYE